MLSDIELENLEFDYLETISSILKADIRNNILPNTLKNILFR